MIRKLFKSLLTPKVKEKAKEKIKAMTREPIIGKDDYLTVLVPVAGDENYEGHFHWFLIHQLKGDDPLFYNKQPIKPLVEQYSGNVRDFFHVDVKASKLYRLANDNRSRDVRDHTRKFLIKGSYGYTHWVYLKPHGGPIDNPDELEIVSQDPAYQINAVYHVNGVCESYLRKRPYMED